MSIYAVSLLANLHNNENADFSLGVPFGNEIGRSRASVSLNLSLVKVGLISSWTSMCAVAQALNGAKAS